VEQEICSAGAYDQRDGETRNEDRANDPVDADIEHPVFQVIGEFRRQKTISPVEECREDVILQEVLLGLCQSLP
jgi:hypothetical protein